MDDDSDVIWIVESSGAALESGVVEVPFRRSEPPNELGKIVPVSVVAVAATFCGEVKLVPPLQLSLAVAASCPIADYRSANAGTKALIQRKNLGVGWA